MFLFGVLTIEIIIIIFQIFKKKLYKSAIVILLWFAVNTFYSPTIYYTVCDGE